MMKLLRKIFGKKPAAPAPRPRPSLMHWVPNSYDERAFCGEDRPAVYTFDVATLRDVEDSCLICRVGGARSLKSHVIRSR